MESQAQASSGRPGDILTWNSGGAALNGQYLLANGQTLNARSAQQAMPTAYTLRRLTLVVATAPGEDQHRTVTLLVNGEETDLAVSVEGAQTAARTGGQEVDVQAFDLVTVRFSSSAGGPSTPVAVSVQLV